jgi:hypothetical protein
LAVETAVRVQRGRRGFSRPVADVENNNQSCFLLLLLREGAVPEIFRLVTDDQLALVICFGAVVLSGLIMHFSVHVGRLTGRGRLHQTQPQRSVVLTAPVQRQEDVAIRERAA